MSHIKNEVGNCYGYLTVIQQAESKKGKAAWLCQCKCGNQIVVTGDALRRGNTKSCGCYQKEKIGQIGKANKNDITNRQFGKLTALYPIGSASYGGVLWECQCECGNKHIAEYSNLVTGKVKSCGCLVSQGEYLIQKYLTEYSIKYKTQFTPENWKLSTGYEPFYDFALFRENELVALIEFHGEQHKKYYTGNTWNNKENFLKTQRRDKEKEDLCKKNNIPLRIIWYNEDIKKSLYKILLELKFVKNKDF